MGKPGKMLSVDLLTEREIEILRLVAEGLSNSEIAEKLVITLGTVKWYNGQIFDKLGVKNRTQAIVRGRELGLLDQDETPLHGAASPGAQHNLPSQPLPFVGRQDELARIHALLMNCRLLTLVGPGGIGKTRMAVEAARMQLPYFLDGVHFVTLAPLSAPEHIVSMIAAVLNLTLSEGSDPRLQLLASLRGKRLLLVLDNFDELLNGVGLVTEILQAAPGVKALVTSRERLNVQEETLFRVEGMPLPDAARPLENDAVQLFIECSRRVRPDLTFSDADLNDVMRICRLVEGMPLGIVLAAAWVEMLSPGEIADEIERSFDFLETDMRNVPPRHRSMRGVFESAWNMLTETERGVFTRLAVFRGGFTREAAQDVAGATLPTLMALVNKSLLRREPGSRFEIHELLRQYAAEQLEQSGKADETRAAHSRHYLGFLWLDASVTLGDLQVEADFENVRAAWNWAVEYGQYDALEAAMDGLYTFCTRHSRHWDALQLFDGAITAASRDTNVQVSDAYSRTLLRLREYRGKIRRLTGDFIGAVADLQHVRYAAHAAGDSTWERDLLIQLGQLYRLTEQHNEAAHYLNKVILFSRGNGNLRAVADALYHLGTVAWDEGDNAQARRYHQEAVDICRRLGLRDIVAVQAFHGLGESFLMSGQPRLAIESFNTSLELARQMGDLSYVSENYQMIGWSSLGSLGSGDYSHAEDVFARSLTISQPAHLEWHTVCSLVGMGLAQGSVGRYGQGIVSLQEGLKLAESLGVVRFICLALDSLGELYQDLNLLDKAQAAHAQVVDHMLKAESTYWLSRAQANLAIDRLRQGDLNVEDNLKTALDIAMQRGQEFHAVRALEGLAELNVKRGEAQQALANTDQLLALAEPRGLREMVAQAHRWRGEALLIAGRLDEAGGELRQAAALAESIARVRLIRDVHAALARYSAAAGKPGESHRQKAQAVVEGMAASVPEDLRMGLMALL